MTDSSDRRRSRTREFTRPGINYLARNPGEKIKLYDALSSLRHQLENTDPAKFPQTWNLGLALLAVGEALSELRSDVALLHNKLQPVLRELQEAQTEIADHRSGKKSR